MDISKARCPECRQPMEIREVHCPACNLVLEGGFEVSALGRLSPEDQVFVLNFLRTHGNIKRMEVLFAISYPTVKNRLNAITAQLDRAFEAPTPNSLILGQLARGEISVEEALRRIT